MWFIGDWVMLMVIHTHGHPGIESASGTWNVEAQTRHQIHPLQSRYEREQPSGVACAALGRSPYVQGGKALVMGNGVEGSPHSVYVCLAEGVTVSSQQLCNRKEDRVDIAVTRQASPHVQPLRAVCLRLGGT